MPSSKQILSHRAVQQHHHSPCLRRATMTPPARTDLDLHHSSCRPILMTSRHGASQILKQFHSIQLFCRRIELPSNRAYHAAAILFFLHPELPDKFPQTKDALHAGWMACFKHPMNFEELRRPPCVGASAYTDEEQKWCSATLQYLVTRQSSISRCGHSLLPSSVAT
jgi:hypothetical protein